MRVLHLIDEGGSGARAVAGGRDAVLRACRVLRDRSACDQDVCIVGGPELEADARSAGLDVAARLPPVSTSAGVPCRALRRLLARCGVPDVVHAWSIGGAHLARTAVGSRGTRVTVSMLDAGPFDGEARRHAARDVDGLPISVCSDAARDEWVTAKVTSPVVIAPPPFPDRGISAAEREHVRAGLGIASDEVAVILLGNAPHADTVRWVFFHGILGIAGTKFTGVVTREAGQFERGVRYFLSAPPKNRLIVSDHAASGLLPGMDAAVFEAGGYGATCGLPARPAAGTLPIAMAHAAGVPVVAPAWAGDERLYPPDVRAALLGTNGAIPELARVLMRLVEDGGLRMGACRSVLDHMTRQNHAGAFVRAIESMWSRDPSTAARSEAADQAKPPTPRLQEAAP